MLLKIQQNETEGSRRFELVRRMQYLNASQQASSDSADDLEWQIQFGFHYEEPPRRML